MAFAFGPSTCFLVYFFLSINVNFKPAWKIHLSDRVFMSTIGGFNLPIKQQAYELYAHSPIAIGIYIGPELVVEFANSRMREIWGRTPEQVLNLPLFKAIPEVSGQGFEEILAEVLATGKHFSGTELPATLERNGKLELCYFNILYEPLRDGEERVYGIIQTAFEVTDLVVAKKKAEESEEMLKLALDAGNMGTWNLDFVQDKLRRSFGYDRVLGYKEMQPEWKTYGFFDHVLPEDREFARAKFEESLHTGLLEYEVRVLWPDQSIHWVQVKGKIEFNLAGTPIHCSGIISDITEQKEKQLTEKQLLMAQAAREEAEKQRAVLHDLFMNAPALICTLIGPDYVYELVNPLYQQLFPDRELVGKPILEALPELKGSHVKGLLDRVFQHGEEVTGNEVPLTFKTDPDKMSEMYFNFVYQPMRNEKNEVIGILAFAFEVSEQIKARKLLEQREDELKRTLDELGLRNKQLTRTNQDLDNFIYTAYHDLKAPISNIEGLLEALASEEEMQEGSLVILEMMSQSVHQFKKTLKDLAEITYLQNEEEQGLQVIAFAEMLREVELSIHGLILKSEAKIHADFHVKEIQYYRKNLRSILYNLVSNAIKYASPERKPEIWLSTVQEGDYTLLTVKDNGVGMNPKNKDKIFGMFSRLHDHVEGTGVGLYLVKRMVENAEGKIEVESELGKGSVLKVYFKD